MGKEFVEGCLTFYIFDVSSTGYGLRVTRETKIYHKKSRRQWNLYKTDILKGLIRIL